MKGDFSRSTFSARMRYGSVTMQQGRVKLDTDWDEKSELQLQSGLVYLDVWERQIEEGAGLPGEEAISQPDTSARTSRGSFEKDLRLVKEVVWGSGSSSTLHSDLGRASGRANESFVLPTPEVTVEGVQWTRVASFSRSLANSQVYMITESADGTRLVFGDGKNGSRPAADSRIVVSYRFGGGGNDPRSDNPPKRPGRRRQQRATPRPDSPS